MRGSAEIVGHLIQRDLRGFIRQIEAFPDEISVWALPTGIANSTGTLALHCAGNIQHYIGARLGGTAFVRDRDKEFSTRMVARAELIAGLERAAEAVRVGLMDRGGKPLPENYPDAVGGKQVRTDVMLAHLAGHLTYHLGQVDYHRRITTGNGQTVDAIAVTELPGL